MAQQIDMRKFFEWCEVEGLDPKDKSSLVGYKDMLAGKKPASRQNEARMVRVQILAIAADGAVVFFRETTSQNTKTERQACSARLHASMLEQTGDWPDRVIVQVAEPLDD